MKLAFFAYIRRNYAKFAALPALVLWYNEYRSKMVKRLEKVKQAVME
ncbi:MAG: hypothetical protein FWF04_02530 [Clostridiales bacterium]|nr:hypothetical protein [Clostridiales bacterium]